MTRPQHRRSPLLCSLIALSSCLACGDEGGTDDANAGVSTPSNTLSGNPPATNLPGSGGSPTGTDPAATQPAPVGTDAMLPMTGSTGSMTPPVETAPDSTGTATGSPDMTVPPTDTQLPPDMMPTDMGAGGMGGMGNDVDMGVGATANDPDVPPVTPEPIVPMVSGNTYSLTVGDATFSADGATGRVTGVSYGGMNLFTDSSVNETNYGSSFWTAPQADWTWPPAVDAADYTHLVDEMNAIVFTSGPVQPNADDPSIEWVVTKRFWGDAEHGAFVLEYTVENLGMDPLDMAPWEISRVRSNGITFYPLPQGADEPYPQDRVGPISTVTVADGMVWFDFTGVDTETKSISDGAEGWLAHVDNGVLFLKTFEDVPSNMQAPGEAEIEIYSDGDDSYVELEQQGPYETGIPSGSTSTPWRVQWKVRPVPADVTVAVESESLISWVRSVVAE